jgi:hypothetical protein
MYEKVIMKTIFKNFQERFKRHGGREIKPVEATIERRKIELMSQIRL